MVGKFFKIALVSFLFLEIVSLLGHIYPIINLIGFFVIAVAALIAALYKFEYGLYFIFAELFIGGKGYLLSFEYGEILISIRMILFVVILGLWLYKFLFEKLKNKNFLFLRNYYLPLFLFILWGVARGFLNNNDFSNIFLDANGWVFFLLVFPTYEAFKDNKNAVINITQILFAAIFVMSLKTIGLFFLFSYSGFDLRLAQAGGEWANSFIFEIYKWIRCSGVGEITSFGNFYRIFFQSHLFILIGLLILLVYEDARNIGQKYARIIFSYVLPVLASAVILISLSRSFWVGGVAGLSLIIVLIKNKFSFLAKFLLIGIISVFLVFLIAPTFSQTIVGRVGDKGEAAISSRQNLLTPLWGKIQKNWILGSGFGTTVLFETQDPRQLKENSSGKYETYAFEWGYLDIWLKMGIGGLLVYLFLIGKLFYKGFLQIKRNTLNIGLLAGLVTLCVVNIFSPYLNHPLGIGYMVLLSVIFNKKDSNNF